MVTSRGRRGATRATTTKQNADVALDLSTSEDDEEEEEGDDDDSDIVITTKQKAVAVAAATSTSRATAATRRSNINTKKKSEEGDEDDGAAFEILSSDDEDKTPLKSRINNTKVVSSTNSILQEKKMGIQLNHVKPSSSLPNENNSNDEMDSNSDSDGEDFLEKHLLLQSHRTNTPEDSSSDEYSTSSSFSSSDNDDYDNGDNDEGLVVHRRRRQVKSNNSSNKNTMNNDSDLEGLRESKAGKRPRFAQRLAMKNKREKLEQAHKRPLQQKKNTGTIHLDDSDNDDDDDGDDDDDEAVVVKVADNNGTKKETIDYPSSDDEDDGDKDNVTARTPKVSNEFTRARKELMTAQALHIDEDEEEEDENVEMEESDSDVEYMETTPATRKNKATPVAKKADLGTLIRVKVRSRQGEDDTFSIRTKEPIQVLLDRYLKKHPAVNPKNVQFHFDGEALPLTSTPIMFDMEDGELIEVHLLS